MIGSNAASFIAAIEAIYAAAPDPSRWPAALQAMADSFGDVGGILLYRRDDGRFGYIVSRSLETLLNDYGRGYVGPDLRAVRGEERGVYIGRDAVTDRHLVSDEETVSHPFYQWLAKHGLKYHVVGAVSPDPRVAVAIAIQRSIDREPYSEHEIEWHMRLCRHAENALRLGIRLLDSEMVNIGLGDALSRLRIGVFALDERRRVVFANAAGEALLGNGFQIADDRLSTAFKSDRDALDAALARTFSAAPDDVVKAPSPILIQRPGKARALSVYVLPVHASHDPAVTHFLTRARAIVLAVDAAPAEPPDPTLVRDLLGLTLSEARVTALVGAGQPPGEAAKLLGITEETARTTLKRVFAKVGVSRQSELSALLAKLVLR
jgi:DNA-binding CsgD family transcriptional regulator/PAS domain-containing protein